MIDIRPSQQYTAGHVPSSINTPFQGTPFFSSNGPGSQTLVIPSVEVITQTLTANGIDVDTQIVIVPDSAILPSPHGHGHPRRRHIPLCRPADRKPVRVLLFSAGWRWVTKLVPS